MKLKTRLTLTAFATVILPLVLTTCAFILLSFYQFQFIHKNYGIETEYNYEVLTNSVQAFSKLTRISYDSLKKTTENNPDKLRDSFYLNDLNNKLSAKSSYLIVKSGNEYSFVGNEADSQALLDKLPAYGSESINGNSPRDYYFGEEQRLVKKADITFTDGSTGVAYIVTKLSSLTPASYILNLVIAITVIPIPVGSIFLNSSAALWTGSVCACNNIAVKFILQR